MITTKQDFDTVVELYTYVKKAGHDIGCAWYRYEDCPCNCELGVLVEKSRKMIEDSAVYLGYVKRT